MDYLPENVGQYCSDRLSNNYFFEGDLEFHPQRITKATRNDIGFKEGLERREQATVPPGTVHRN
jgi:hypothetical protein